MIERLCQQISQRDSKRNWIDNAKTHRNCCIIALLSYIFCLVEVITKGLLEESQPKLC